MDMSDLLARYEARGEERDFVAAKSLFEQAIADAEEARLLTGYGYLLESHGRNEMRQAVALYERAIELDPDDDKPHYHLIGARAGLREPERAVALYATIGRVAGVAAGVSVPRPRLPHGARLHPRAGDRRGRAHRGPG
jgi:tetratricopeptide (TPR) repeat protein